MVLHMVVPLEALLNMPLWSGDQTQIQMCDPDLSQGVF